jgi:hypothetical protein
VDFREITDDTLIGDGFDIKSLSEWAAEQMQRFPQGVTPQERRNNAAAVITAKLENGILTRA